MTLSIKALSRKALSIYDTQYKRHSAYVTLRITELSIKYFLLDAVLNVLLMSAVVFNFVF